MTNSELNIQIPNAEAVIAALALEPHIEGGFYRRTFQSDHHAMVEIKRRYRRAMFAAACTWWRLESFAAYEWFSGIRFDQ
jgi:predicted cupin superfamily sugar epimerase